MTDFIVRFEGVKLSNEATKHLQAAIGAAVDGAMSSASFTPNPDGDGHCVFIPIKWPGRWIVPQSMLKANPAIFEGRPTVAIAAKGG